MDHNAAASLAVQLMADHGLHQNGWSFQWDNRLTRCGWCNYTHQVIGLSRAYVSHATEEDVRDTILHEIAHALVGPHHGHNNVWRSKAVSIGCNGARTSRITVPKKYIATCVKCSHVYYRQRIPKNNASCGRCSHGGYNPDLKLNWEINKQFSRCN